MNLDLQLLDSFVTLVEEGHFARAARRLHLTGSALSKRLHRLESDLGTLLVERRPGRLTLTPAGARLAEEAPALLAHGRRVTDHALAGAPVGTIRIGVPAGFAAFVQHPGVRAALRAALDADHLQGRRITLRHLPLPFGPSLHEALTTGDVDLVWTIAPVRHPGVESVQLPLTCDRLGIVGARHPLAEADQVGAEEFLRHPLLFHPGAPGEWMEPFWLADVPDSTDARLIPTDGADISAVLRDAARSHAAMTTLAILAPQLGPTLHPVALPGLAPLTFYLAHRTGEPRSDVRHLPDALGTGPARHLRAR